MAREQMETRNDQNDTRVSSERLPWDEFPSLVNYSLIFEERNDFKTTILC